MLRRTYGKFRLRSRTIRPCQGQKVLQNGGSAACASGAANALLFL
jgi:hypothetical protein